MAEHSLYIDVDGHQVPAAHADLFFNPDGSRVTDEQWDRRKAAREDADGTNTERFVPEEHR